MVLLHPHCLVLQNLDLTLLVLLNFLFGANAPSGQGWAICIHLRSSWNHNQCQNGQFCRNHDLQQK